MQAADGEEALAAAREHRPDLILLDVMMPKLDGIEVCRRLKDDPTLPFMPIILVTAKADTKDVVAGLDAGADEYLTKPLDQPALVARVKSVLRIKELHDKVQAQADELATWNRTLEQRVADQLAEIERISRLKRFLSPKVAELIVLGQREGAGEPPRRSHRGVLRSARLHGLYGDRRARGGHVGAARLSQTLGGLIHQFEGTSSVLPATASVLFNAPLPCRTRLQAVNMAVEYARSCRRLARWLTHGHDLGFGVGIAHGYATLGRIGFEGRFDYSATGTVVNLAARLCSERRTAKS